MKNTCTLHSIVFSALACVACIGVAHAEVYKHVDENGRVTYSDKKTDNSSEKLDMKTLNTLPAVQVSEPKKKPAKSMVPTSYDINITAPAPESHVNPGQRDLSIQVSTTPGVYKEHTLQISDNGAVIQGTVIQNISRGTHVLLATIIGKNGRVISTSQPVTVYVHRPSVSK